MEWTNRALAVVLVCTLIAPSWAWAEETGASQPAYPREMTVNGLYCIQTETDIWCKDGGKLVQMRQRAGDGTIAVSFPVPTPAASAGPAGSWASADTVDLLGDAAVKYSWSGPLKWSAISNALLAIAFFASDVDGGGTAGAILFGASALSLAIALGIDSSANKDLERAAGRHAPFRQAVSEADDEEGEDDEE